MNGSVIVFKGDDDGGNSLEDPYVEILTKFSFNPRLIAALNFEFYNLDVLKERLDQPHNYSGIILSSPRCLQAVQKSGSLSLWKDKKIFTVGSKTASLVRDVGGEPLGEECGNASSLADFILKDYSSLELQLLLPHGSLSLKTLPNMLTEGGLKVDLVEVYRTSMNQRLEESIKNVYRDWLRIDFVIFMSPSAVEYCLPLLEKFQDLSNIKFIALGPSTASALEDRGIIPAGMSEKPTPRHVLAAMTKFIPVQNES